MKQNKAVRTKPNKEEWLLNNLVYCEDTHSFTHRLFDKIRKGISKYLSGDVSNPYTSYTYKDAQQDAKDVLDDLYKEYKKVKQ